MTVKEILLEEIGIELEEENKRLIEIIKQLK